MTARPCWQVRASIWHPDRLVDLRSIVDRVADSLVHVGAELLAFTDTTIRGGADEMPLPRAALRRRRQQRSERLQPRGISR